MLPLPPTFRATVTTASGAQANGRVTFTVTGQDGTPVACVNGFDNVIPLHKGTAHCAMARGALLASNAPYTVTATYSGTNRFAPSTTQLDQQVRPGAIRVSVGQSSRRSHSGKPVNFSASAYPRNEGGPELTGQMGIRVTDFNGNHVDCPITSQSTTSIDCRVPEGVLTAADGPYTVSGSYFDDPNYADSGHDIVHRVPH